MNEEWVGAVEAKPHATPQRDLGTCCFFSSKLVKAADIQFTLQGKSGIISRKELQVHTVEIASLAQC